MGHPGAHTRLLLSTCNPTLPEGDEPGAWSLIKLTVPWPGATASPVSALREAGVFLSHPLLLMKGWPPRDRARYTSTFKKPEAENSLGLSYVHWLLRASHSHQAGFRSCCTRGSQLPRPGWPRAGSSPTRPGPSLPPQPHGSPASPSATPPADILTVSPPGSPVLLPVLPSDPQLSFKVLFYACPRLP